MEQAQWDWLLNSVRYFRGLGFFSQDSELSDEQLAHHVGPDEGAMPPSQPAEVVERPDTGDPELDELIWKSVRPRPDYRDLNLLCTDETRIWWEDGEGDIHPGDNVYTRTIEEWSRISRGAFQPTDIREVWDHPEKWPDCRVTVHFLLNGQAKALEPWDGYGWIDFTLTTEINQMISETGFSYKAFDTQDQTTCLVVLTAEEKNRLVEERGWKFTD